MPETRIKAHSSPRTVESSSEPMVTTTVSQTPCNRIGRNSTASRRKFCIDQVTRCFLPVRRPWPSAPICRESCRGRHSP